MRESITTKVVTGKCRLSYAHIWEPHQMEGATKAKYGACIVIPKTDGATISKLQAAVDAAIQDGVKNKWKGKKPANLKLPLRDGDEERPEDETFSGCCFINANSDRQPGVVGLDCLPILNQDEIYSGCYCRFSVTLYPFSVNGNNGVACGLNHVQKVADGEPLSGRSRAEDDFDDGYAGDMDDIL